jgi:hypothetical protein
MFEPSTTKPCACTSVRLHLHAGIGFPVAVCDCV